MFQESFSSTWGSILTKLSFWIQRPWSATTCKDKRIQVFSSAATLPPRGSDPSPLFLLQIIEWLCDNVNTFSCFDQIQEFILGQFQRSPQIRPVFLFLPCILFYLFYLLWRIWWLLRTWKLLDSRLTTHFHTWQLPESSWLIRDRHFSQTI